jgi:hypothetical protein
MRLFIIEDCIQPWKGRISAVFVWRRKRVVVRVIREREGEL